MKLRNAITLALTLANTALLAYTNNLVGEYSDVIKADKGPFKDNPELCFRVHKEGGDYKVDIVRDLWRRCKTYAQFSAKEQNGEIVFENLQLPYLQGPRASLTGKITKDKIEGTYYFKQKENGVEKEYTFPFEVKRIERESPTLNMKPPKGAAVLFNGSNFSEWRACNNKPIAWKLDKKEKSMMGALDANKQSSDIETKRKFKNCRLHIEFMTPDQSERGYMGQQRGNSGVFFGRFEVQILDSFGANGEWDECGALYRFMPPQFNASLPPERWQTYDIVFYGAKDKNGKLERNPRITVYHNGMKIHNDVEIWEGTDWNSCWKSLKNLREHSFPIKLQWHNEPVKFRNIWIEEIKDEDVAIIPEIITKKNFRE